MRILFIIIIIKFKIFVFIIVFNKKIELLILISMIII